MIRPWLKAGLVGGAILGMLTVLSTFSLFLSESVRDLVTCCVCCLQMSIYPAVGILAAFWIISPRSTGQGARTGALAGLVAGGVDGVVTLLAGLASVMLGASQRYLADLPVDVFHSWWTDCNYRL
jgi:hypothetical protein